MISLLAKIYPFVLLAVCILAVPLSAHIKKMEQEKRNSFRMMRAPMFVGVATGIVWAVILMVIAFSEDASMGAYIALAVFSLLSLALISSFFAFHIEYDHNGFTHRNALGIKRHYRYTDVTGISGEKGDITIYADGHKIRIDEAADTKSYGFISFVKKQYRKNNGGNALPKKRAKTDIFNGNVNNPGEFIFVYALMYVLMIGMFIFIAVTWQPTKAEDLIYQTVAFDRYVIEKDETSDDLCLYVGELEYRMNSYENYLKNADHLLSLCDGKTLFEIGVTDGKTCYHIETLATKDGVSYLTLEETNQSERKNMIGLFLFFGGFLVFWTVFVVLSIMIGRNPKKYPKWLVHGFFKPSYIDR